MLLVLGVNALWELQPLKRLGVIYASQSAIVKKEPVEPVSTCLFTVYNKKASPLFELSFRFFLCFFKVLYASTIDIYTS
jgi:hypothetical protein